MSKKEIKQKMIYMCDLPIGIGSEFSGLHPCLIVSVDTRNENCPNIFIFPITHSKRKWQPTHYELLKKEYDFFKYTTNTVLCESGREISRSRVQRYLGIINDIDFDKIMKNKEYIYKEYKNNS